jgi:hypothetical protein
MKFFALAFALITSAMFMPFMALADENEDPDFALEAERQILEHTDPEAAEEAEKELLYPVPEKTIRDHFDFNLKRGLEFKHQFNIKESEFAMSIYGPMDKKKPGVVMKIKGNYGGHNIKFKAYGNIKKQGFLFTMDF